MQQLIQLSSSFFIWSSQSPDDEQKLNYTKQQKEDASYD